ncbi:uncharacterized protein BX663DRAFT_242425 [Cokeromyces recurvatus]|uniref:uncharacterized protein n=1 Tax=Cokeromyces recurvatus TaxID=90255 RepID=UPI0022203A17|nr:uncharacterized protein BX663DRAFT_242425 [Cokeromyces recurvatus]KAI7905832.1 hypothetical protein BX663DRAFT_242425 [Cokeromyces recurvatus]
MNSDSNAFKNLDKVPNLVSEEPSDSTPPNTSYMDMSESKFSNMLEQQRKEITKKCKNTSPLSSDRLEKEFARTRPEKGSVEDFTLADWDASTNYQDKDHKSELSKRM